MLSMCTGLIYSKLPGATDYAASFAFEKEDHTLGNALRYMIMKKYATVPLITTIRAHADFDQP